MKFFSFLFVLTLLIVSCVPAQNVTALPLPNVTITVTATPSPKETATLPPPSPTTEPTKIPCNPLAVDYCITDGHFIFRRPIDPPGNASVDGTYRYASTANGKREPHHGVEFLNKFGTPVHAAADGVVVFAGPDTKAIYCPWVNFYGNLIVLKHDQDLYTLYAHLSKIDVQAGDVVQAGQKIGEVGQTGVAIGSHLHFEVRRGDVENYFSTFNPELWLAPENDAQNLPYGALMISITDSTSKHLFTKLTIVRYSDPSAQPDFPYYLDTYVNDMAKGDENAALGSLQAGRYRIALESNGQLIERWVEVQSGKLTQTVIVVK